MQQVATEEERKRCECGVGILFRCAFEFVRSFGSDCVWNTDAFSYR